jgi:hypothetical protein
MKQTLCACVMGAGLVLQLSCDGGQATAPPVTEQLSVTSSSRAQVQGEPIPTTRVTGGASAITFQVSSTGPCAAILDSGLSRRGSDLSVVTRIWGNPLADCIVPPSPRVLEYEGSIAVGLQGVYRVRIFEANGNEEPRLIGSTVATVGAQ